MIKRYIIAFLAICLILLCFGGCNSDMAAKGNIISLKITGNGTTQDNDYNYYIREENGKILFDAYYRTFYEDGEYREVKIENAVVTDKDMQDLRYWCDEYVFAEKQKTKKAGKKDAEKFKIEAVWENKKRIVKEITLNNDDTLEITPLSIFEGITRQFEDCYYTVPEKPSAEGRVVSLEFSYKGSMMSQYSDYRYYIREENGEVLFDAHSYFGKNFKKITLENAVVTREDMDALIKIYGEKNLAEKQKNQAIASSSVYIAPPWAKTYREIMKNAVTDGPHYPEIFQAKWENGATLYTSPPHGDEKLILLNYLDMMMIRLALPPAEGDIISFEFYGRDGIGHWDSYSYRMYEEDNKIIFYAFYAEDYKRKKLLGISVTREDMEALQAICEKYDFAGNQQTYRPSLPPDFNPDPIEGEEKQTFLKIEWKNGAILNANMMFGSEESLKTFLFELAMRFDDLAEPD